MNVFTESELEVLRDEDEVVLYRARQPGNPVSVLVLAVRDERSKATVRLEHEYGLATVLDSGWAARPLMLDRQNSPTRLILEDYGGNPLRDSLGQPLELARFLRLSINLAMAVSQVHRHGLIHKDIQPANILVDAQDNVRLTGFGISSRLMRERQQPTPPETIAGTFAYMAPEQTGRMNRSIDPRSDLYSLGVTLYEMITGSLPFTASDAMEWFHCHIAQIPSPPSERLPGIPATLEAIVLKLLAKTAEERYQTAGGAAADLQTCLAAWESLGHIEPFPLGTRDASDRLMVPEKLYGREHEIDRLLAAFDRVVTRGTPELVLVSGPSGIGKSSVVNELHKVLVPPRGLFSAGKFDQYKRDIPYATIAQAFQRLVRALLGKSETELGRWRDEFRDSLGQNVQLIVNLVPELELVTGPYPPVPDLPPQDAKNRFQMVFRRFLAVFARKEHPLTLFLDDLQWLDTATLDLMEHLVTHPDVQHVFLIGAYRDNEVSLAHRLPRTLDAIRKAGVRVEEIALGPLRLGNVSQLVADAVRCEPDRALQLAQLVHEKTGGNPFFTIQFFTALAEEELLVFDAATTAWTWDIDRIRAKSYTDNVVDLIAERLKRFAPTTRQAMIRLACLGNTAEIATLSLVHGQSDEATQAAFQEAVHAGLVVQIDCAYRFLHDRIQQAAYSLIPTEHQAEFHLHLGRVLLAAMTEENLAEHLFDVANQLNRGAALVARQDEKIQAAMINLRAGRKAKASAAFASACIYLAAGMAQLGESDWNGQYGLMYGLWFERAECEFLSSNFETAEQIIKELFQRGLVLLDLAEVYRLKIQLHEVKAEYSQALESALTCLRLFGIDLPADPTREQVQTEYDAVWRNLDGRAIDSLINLPLMTDPELQAAMRLLSILLNTAYYTDFQRFFLYLCRLVNVSIQRGTSAPSTHAYGWFGNIIGALFHRYRDGHSLGKLACDLVEKHEFTSYRARVHLTMNTVAIWTQPLSVAFESNRLAFLAATDTGDLAYACYSIMHNIADLLVRNDPLDGVRRETEKGFDFVEAARYRDIADTIVIQQRFVASMQGRTAALSTFSDAEFDEMVFESQLTTDRMVTMVCYYWIIKLKARFLSGDYTEALSSRDKAKALLWSVTGQIYLLDYIFYSALTVAALYGEASSDERVEWNSLLNAHCKQLCEWAEYCPSTFGDKSALVSAEIARLEGRDSDAMRMYELAIQSARDYHFVQNQGVAHELAAQFYLLRGSTTASRAHLEEARGCFAYWGADAKVRQLEQHYPSLREHRRSSSTASGFDIALSQIDAATVLKASRAVSGEMLTDPLIKILMMIAVEHAGAERGLLILPRGGGYGIEAEATTRKGTVEVILRQADATSAELSRTVLLTVMRTRESVILYDAAEQPPFSEDEYVRRHRARSVLCLPLMKQGVLGGMLYLENSLASHVFTPARLSVLEHLALQAAISLENASLFAELKQAEAFLVEAQRLSRTGSFAWNISSGEILWSEEAGRLFGYDDPVEPNIDLVLSRVHPDDLSLVQEVLNHATRDGDTIDFEYRLLMPDGAIKHVHVVARPVMDDPDNPRFVGALMDVTASKLAHAELERGEQRYRQLFQDIPVALWQIDSGPLGSLLDDVRTRGVTDLPRYIDDHPELLRRAAEVLNVTEVNNSAIQMFGARDRSELLGSLLWLFRESLGTFRHKIESGYRGEALFQETARLATRDGRILHVLVTVVRPHYPDHLATTLMSMVDLTELVRAQETLQQLQADFAHAARISMLGELTASIAHELGQPLAAITLNALAGLRWLDRPKPDLAELRTTTQGVVANVKRAGDIITRIRGMAAHKQKPERQLISIDEIVLEALEFIRHEVQSRGVTILSDFARKTPKICVDRVQFQQVIVNLTINAMQAMAQVNSHESKITIRTRMFDVATVYCAVEDCGTGIVPDQAARLFDSFFTTKDGGMGMGLSVCRSIVEAHGGRIGANNDSAHGGACFYFTVPVAVG